MREDSGGHVVYIVGYEVRNHKGKL
jgi:hypothetical protein